MRSQRARLSLPTTGRRPAGVLLAALLAAALTLTAACGEAERATDRLQRAKDLQAEGKLRSAVIELKNALAADPDLAEARWLLGQAYLVTGDGAGALKEFRLARRLGFADPDLELALNRALLVAGEYPEALVTAVMHPQRDHDSRWRLVEGEALLGLGKYAEARDTFNRVLETEPDNTPARRGLARASIETGETETARSTLDKALESEARDLEALVLKGELEMAERRPGQALDAFASALEIDPSHPVASIGRARALLAAGRLEEAVPVVGQLVQLHPRDPETLFLAVTLARLQGDRAGTARAATELLSLVPDHAPTLMLLAEVHFLDREFALAEERLRSYLAARPREPRAQRLLGNVLMELGRIDEAVAVLQEAERSAPLDAALLTTLGRAFLAKGEQQTAQEYLDRAAELAPGVATVQTEAAIGHLLGGDPAQAVVLLESVLADSPGMPRAEVLLVLAHLRAGERDAAVSAAQAVAERRPDRHEAQDLLALVLEAAGRRDAAREASARSLQMSPGNRAAALNLARLDLLDGDIAGAKAGFEGVLANDPDNAISLLGLATIANREGRTADSVALLERARRKHPRAVQPRLVLGNYYLAQARPREAMAIADEAVRAAPGHASARFLQARALLADRQPDQAIAIMRELAETVPATAELYFQLGVAHGQAGNHDGARDAFEHVLELAPKDLRARTALAGLALARGDTDTALAQARALQADYPDNAQGYLLQADALMTGADHAAALALYRRAHQLQPTSASLLKLADAHRIAGDSAAAGRLVDDWLAGRPDDVAVRLSRATHRHAAGDFEAAAGDYEQALARSPDHAMALNNLAWLYFDRGDPRALELARRAWENDPERAEVLDTYGWLLVANDSVEQGLPLLEKATAGAPGNPDIVYHYAAALARAGERQRAAKFLDVLVGAMVQFPNREAALALRRSLDGR